jgi:hypothetical protein
VILLHACADRLKLAPIIEAHHFCCASVSRFLRASPRWYGSVPTNSTRKCFANLLRRPSSLTPQPPPTRRGTPEAVPRQPIAYHQIPWLPIFGRQALDIPYLDVQLIGFRRGALLQLFNAALKGGTRVALLEERARGSEFR